MKTASGFTLIELLVSVVILTIISSTVYFAVNGALESWSYCRDQLSLQKVLTETMDDLVSGTSRSFGLKDSLEIVAAGRSRVEFIPPWIDETHASSGREFTYKLNRRLKAGAPVPIGEIRMAETDKWKLVPVQKIALEDSETTQIKLTLSVPEGSDLRFIYHPDWVADPDTVRKVFWDKDARQLMMDSGDSLETISKNFFDVTIEKVELRYFTTNNERVTDREWVDEADLQIITGVEVEIEARVGERTQKLIRFVNLRNAPMRTGYLTLKKGMRIPIPDSKAVRALMVTNLSGIANNDILQLEALPRAGQPWRVTVEFERIGTAQPVIKSMNVEYPLQHTVYSDLPRMSTDLGVNMLLLGPDGLFDYDDDEDVDDAVTMEGDVMLTVNEMTIDGAGLFVRP